RTPPELDEFHRLARDVSKTTYQERLLDSGLPEDDAFVANMRAEAAADRIRAYLIFDGERPVAYLYCPIEDGTVIYAYLGYVPEYGRHSVGSILQWDAMERLFAEARYRIFDFTPGDGQHKRQFATNAVRCADVVVLPATVPNRLLIASHRNFVRSVEGVGTALDRLGLKARIKGLLRR
ncbi:MAG: GNAT family N-acetyltransferase, partial [Pseudomonadota bacterium]